MGAFLTGMAAGYGIAIPVGAIAVLIVNVGIRCGFRCAVFAGAGAATADLAYATAAVIGGAALADPIDSIDEPVRFASAIVLIVIGAVGLHRAGSEQQSIEISYPDRRELARTYARFAGLTIINPTTVVYFAAVIVGLGVAGDMTATEGALFAIGAFLASLSWQTLLAGAGAFARGRVGPRTQRATVIVGNLLILAFASLILVQ